VASGSGRHGGVGVFRWRWGVSSCWNDCVMIWPAAFSLSEFEFLFGQRKAEATTVRTECTRNTEDSSANIQEVPY
jgi:hypothetical protein